jgi:hypothetical protein
LQLPKLLALESEPQGEPNSAAAVNAFLTEAIEESTEVRVGVDRIKPNLPVGRIHRKAERSKKGDRLIAARRTQG